MRLILLVSAFLFSFIHSYSQFTITATGTMNVGRALPESQLLNNGQVLIFGGDDAGTESLTYYNSAELYNPNTESWTLTSSMSTKRGRFASVLLADGRVLAIGGENENGKLNSCEIYDPSSGIWSSAASMNLSRSYHKAVRLLNGMVLVVGGTNDKKCEIYDPVTNTWRYTSDTKYNHINPALTLMKDGRVLVTGGSYNLPEGASAEIFNQYSESWTVVGNMNYARAMHSTVCLDDGRILITGNSNVQDNSGSIPEIFNPSGNYFIQGSAMINSVSYCPMVLLDNGNVLEYGIGDIAHPADTKNIQIYSPTTGKWTSGGSFSFIGSVGYSIHKLHNGKILIAGGIIVGSIVYKTCSLVSQDASACNLPLTNLAVSGQTVCSGKYADVIVKNSESDVTYQLYIGDRAIGNTVTGGGDITLSILANNLIAGTNVFKVKALRANCSGYVLSNPAVVNVTESSSAAPTVTASGPLSFCKGGSVTLNASGYSSYLWSTGYTSANLSLTNEGCYSVKGIDAQGCATASSTITQVTILPVNLVAGPSESFCINGGIKYLQDWGPLGGTWSGPGVSADGYFNPAIAGAGTFTLTYSSCGSSVTKTVTVTGLPKATDYILSKPDSVCKNYTADIVIINPQWNAHYELCEGSKIIMDKQYNSNGQFILTTPSINVETVYSIRAIMSNNCSSDTLIKTFKIVPVSNPVIQTVIVSDTICNSNKPYFKIPYSNQNVLYRLRNANIIGQWIKGNSDTLTFIGDYPGGYSVESTNLLKCSTVQLKSVNVVNVTPEAKINIDQDYFVNEEIQIQNLSTYSNSFDWKFDESASIANSNIQSPESFHYTTAGIKTIKLYTSSKFGCKDSIEQKIMVFEPTISADPSICRQDSLSLENNPIVLSYHVDKDNNSYVSSTYPVNSYPFSFTSVLKKFDRGGNESWKITQGRSSYPAPNDFFSAFITGITTDDDNNVYITGSFKSNKFKLGNKEVSMASASNQMFIAKLDSNGEAKWLIYSNGIASDDPSGTDIKFVDSEHIYVSVVSPYNLIFPDGSNISFSSELILLQLNSNGKLIRKIDDTNAAYSGLISSWFVPDLGTIYDGGSIALSPKMKLSKNGDLYLAGKFSSGIFGDGIITPLKFGSVSINPIPNGYATGFVAVLDTASGWKRVFATHGIRSSNSYSPITVIPTFDIDENDNFYLADTYNSVATKQPTSRIILSNGDSLGNGIGSLICKYDINGNVVWRNHTSGLRFTHSLIVDNDQVFLYGDFNNSIVEKSGTSFKGIKAIGKRDIFLSSLDKDGNVNWLTQFGTEKEDVAHFMYKNSCGILSLTGTSGGDYIASGTSSVNGKSFYKRIAPNGLCNPVCENYPAGPKVIISTSISGTTQADVVSIKIVFSKPVIGLSISDIITTNGVITSLQGKDSLYTAELSLSNSGMVTIFVSSYAAYGLDGGANIQSNKITFEYIKNDPPVISMTCYTTDFTNVNLIQINVDMSEWVTDFSIEDIQISNGTLNYLQGSKGSYILTITPDKIGEIVLSIPAGSVHDYLGKANEDFTFSLSYFLLPTVKLSLVESGVYSLTLSGGIINNGVNEITEKGFCWSLNPNPTIEDNRLQLGSGESGFQGTISDLTTYTGYYIRAYAINSDGISYSEQSKIYTGGIVMFSTTSVLQYNSNSATIQSIVSFSDGTITESGYCWSLSPNPTINDFKNQISFNPNEGVTGKINGLVPNTKYYVRAYAINDAGLAYGEEVSFTTSLETGINNNALGKIVSVYPNPTNGNFFIKIDNLNTSSLELKITNSNGVILYQNKESVVGNGYQRDFDQLKDNKGIYFIELITDSEIYRTKVVIQ